MRTNDIIRAWRVNAPKLPGVERLVISARRVGPPGRDIDVRLSGPDPTALKNAVIEVRDLLSAYPGLSAIADDLPYGKPEVIMKLTARGKALGFTPQLVGNQVRDAFEGAIARRFTLSDEEVTIRVKRIQDGPGIATLQRLSCARRAASSCR